MKDFDWRAEREMNRVIKANDRITQHHIIALNAELDRTDGPMLSPEPSFWRGVLFASCLGLFLGAMLFLVLVEIGVLTK